MIRLLGLTVCTVFVVGCTDEISSDEEARRAYFGLDASIQKSLTLGFAGFNAAQSANISPQMATGGDAGTLVITGQVDQGASDNKGMRLRIAMVGYTDGAVVIDGETLDVHITYDTDPVVDKQPSLDLQLKNFPNGTLNGTLVGAYHMDGDLEGDVELNLTFSGATADTGGGQVGRVPGSTTVTGTAKSGDGTYEVNLKI